MAHLPLVLELEGIRCLVVGAGRVAERKINDFARARERARQALTTAEQRLQDWAAVHSAP